MDSRENGFNAIVRLTRRAKNTVMKLKCGALKSMTLSIMNLIITYYQMLNMSKYF